MSFGINKFKIHPYSVNSFQVNKIVYQSIFSIKLFNILGKNVLQLRPNHNDSKNDVTNLSVGFYLLKNELNNSVNIEKLVIKLFD